MPKIRSNGINLYYEIAGAGEPLVLIAGLGYSLWMWHRMVPGLARNFRVMTFDNRGVGQSDQPAGPYSAQMLADDTAGLIAALGLECAAVMGHSMGGFIAQALVLNHPESVSKLILSATNFGGPRQIPVTPEAMKVLTDVSGDPLDRLKRGILISCAPGFGDTHATFVREWLDWRALHPIAPEAYKAQLAIGLGLMSEEASFEHKLKNIKVPTLILFGSEDKVVPPENAELLAKQIQNSQVRILPNAGHFFPFDSTDAAIAAITDFLKS